MKTSVLKENIDKDIFDRVLNTIQKRLDIVLDDYSDEYTFVGGGSYARVYQVDKYPNKVIRIEDDIYESFFVDVAGVKFKNVVRVYYSSIVNIQGHAEEKDIEITVMEKLEALSKIEYQEIDYLLNVYNTFYDDQLKEDIDSEDFDFPDIINIVKDVLNGLDELQDYNIYLNDLHSGNIMRDPKTGKAKIIDLSNV